jgi:hypothetical protein
MKSFIVLRLEFSTTAIRVLHNLSSDAELRLSEEAVAAPIVAWSTIVSETR